jgi:SAM-dependent methyltransferase
VSLKSIVHSLLSRLRVSRLDGGRAWHLPGERYAREEAVMWAHRLVRGAEAPDGAALAQLARVATGREDLLGRIRGDCFSVHGEPPWQPGPAPEDRREAARWAYRLILGREPDSASALEQLAAQASARAMRDQLIQSDEARAQPGFPVVHAMSGDEPPQFVQCGVDDDVRAGLFARVQKSWHALGEEQPHWSVVTSDDFRPDRIGETHEEFYATGGRNVATLLRTLARNGIDASRLGRVMDFGCGVGRLTLALAKEFRHVDAVDVSSSHLAVAREAIARQGVANVTAHLLETIDGVTRLPRVDLVYSVIVLQHNPPPVIHALFAGLLGRLEPGGVAVIQVPTYLPAGYRFDASEYEKQTQGGMEMHPLPQREVFAIAKAAGVDVLEVLEDGWTGYGAGSRSNTFVLQRPA